MPSPLAAELLGILQDVTTPMRPDSLSRVLHVTGYVDNQGAPIPIEQINTALQELMIEGRLERVLKRGRVHYRATAVVVGCDQRAKEKNAPGTRGNARG